MDPCGLISNKDDDDDNKGKTDYRKKSVGQSPNAKWIL